MPTDRARTTLLEQHGVEPGTARGALELAILRHDPSLDASPLSRVAPGEVDTWNEDVRAGDDAHTRGELANAMAAYRSALATSEGGSAHSRRECEVLIRLAEVEYLAGDPAHRESRNRCGSPRRPPQRQGPPGRAASPPHGRWRPRPLESTRARRDVEKGGRSRNHHGDQGTHSRRPRIRAHRRTRSRRAAATERRSVGLRTRMRRPSRTAPGPRRPCVDDRAPDTLAERLSNTAEDLLLTAGDGDLRRRWGAWSPALTCLDAGMVAEAEDNDRLAGKLADELMPGAQVARRFVEAQDLTRAGDLRNGRAASGRGVASRAVRRRRRGIHLRSADLSHPLAAGTGARAAQHLDSQPLASALDRRRLTRLCTARPARRRSPPARRPGRTRLRRCRLRRLLAHHPRVGGGCGCLKLGDEAIMSELYDLLHTLERSMRRHRRRRSRCDDASESLSSWHVWLESPTPKGPSGTRAASHARLRRTDLRTPVCDLEWGRFLAAARRAASKSPPQRTRPSQPTVLGPAASRARRSSCSAPSGRSDPPSSSDPTATPRPRRRRARRG